MIQSKQNKTILFIGHDASRTGAPLLLLETIRWISSNSPFRPVIILKRGGPLMEEYQNLGRTYCLSDEMEKLRGGILRRAIRKIFKATVISEKFLDRFSSEDYPLVYANTIDTCDVLVKMATKGRRAIHHIHELAYCTNYYGATEMMKNSANRTNAYIAVSGAVHHFLVDGLGLPKESVHTIHEFPIAESLDQGKREDFRLQIRHDLSIPTDALVVGMCGLPQWRKGADLFVQLAMQVHKRLGPLKCHFVWLGGDEINQRETLYDITLSGLSNVCHLVPAVDNPERYFGVFDLFALTSREDPFSVAMLEASLCGLPVVCFAGAGGAPELVEEDAGVVVPYLDVAAMADACISLLNNENLRLKMGRNGKNKVQNRYLLAKQGPKILKVIEHIVGSNEC